MKDYPVTVESIAKAKAAAKTERNILFTLTGVAVDDNGVIVVTPNSVN